MAVSGRERLRQSLLPLSPLELAYKKMHELRDDPKAQSAYLDEIRDFAAEQRMIIPGRYEHPETISERDYYPHVPISRGSNVHLVPHARYTPEFHYRAEYFEIYYVMQGTTHHTLAEQEISLTEGDVLFIPLGMRRSIRNFDDSRLISIHIRHDTFDDAFFSTLRYNNIISDFFMSNLYSRHPAQPLLFPTGDDLDVRDIILDMYMEAQQGDAYSWRLLNNLVAMFFAKLLRGYADKAIVGGSVQSAESHSGALAMLSYINDHYRTVTLEDLAQEFNYSVPYCSKLIREETGIGFSNFVRQVKMNHAVPLLVSTKTSVADIANMVGYETPESFIRAFQKVYEMTPSAYRKQQTQTE